jgi:CelD/BcsL family acetyltransferase involved in cellulose biosynthesis
MAGTEGKPAKVEVHTSLDMIADDWKAIQASGYATPYQTLDWTKAWVETLGKTSGLKPHFIRSIDTNGQTSAIVPIGLSKSILGTKAIFLGGKHSNFNMMVMSQLGIETLVGPALDAMLKAAAEQCGIDCYHFVHQPFVWMGRDNPLLTLPFTGSANTAYRADLIPNGDAMIRSLMSSESRKKLRNKEKRLGELGSVSFKRADTPEDIECALSAFLTQKAARFKNQGLDNPFASPEAVAFLRHGSLENSGSEPPFSLFYLTSGERIVSMLGGTHHAGRMSGMFTSFDDAVDIIRFSPGDLLLLHLVQHLANKKFEIFDLGTGDATYKGDYCKIEENLFDSVLPMTARGKLLAATLTAAYGAKRWIKNSPAALKLARRLR